MGPPLSRWICLQQNVFISFHSWPGMIYNQFLKKTGQKPLPAENVPRSSTLLGRWFIFRKDKIRKRCFKNLQTAQLLFIKTTVDLLSNIRRYSKRNKTFSTTCRNSKDKLIRRVEQARKPVFSLQIFYNPYKVSWRFLAAF